MLILHVLNAGPYKKEKDHIAALAHAANFFPYMCVCLCESPLTAKEKGNDINSYTCTVKLTHKDTPPLPPSDQQNVALILKHKDGLYTMT